MTKANIDTDFEAAIDAGKIWGAHLCATDSKGNFVYEKTLGDRTLVSGEKVPYKLDDIHNLASATKLLTTIAALKCVEDGILSLTGDLSPFIPELNKLQVVNGFADDSDTPLLEPQKDAITLKMLLTHSSGLSYWFADARIPRWREKTAPRPKGQPQPVEGLFDNPLAFQPGTGWEYGSSVDWAGRAVERATGKTLGDYLQDKVFDPLGIKDTSFFPVTREDLRARLVDLNPQDPDGVGIAVMGGGDPSWIRAGKGHFGGHGAALSAADYLKVQKSLLSNDGKLLKPSTVDSMFEQHLTAEPAKVHEKVSTGPLGPLIRVGVPPEVKVGYGLGGLVTLESVDGWYGERTLSWGGGYTIAWFIDRQNDLAGFVAVQLKLPVIDGNIAATLKQVFREDIYRKRSAGITH